MSSKRPERVADRIVKELSELIIRGEIKDPRVSSISITGAKVTDNLGMAEIYFTVLGGEGGRKAAQGGLERAKGFIRGRLAERLDMRKVPDIKFKFDSTIEKGYKIDEILRGISGE